MVGPYFLLVVQPSAAGSCSLACLEESPCPFRFAALPFVAAAAPGRPAGFAAAVEGPDSLRHLLVDTCGVWKAKHLLCCIWCCCCWNMCAC